MSGVRVTYASLGSSRWEFASGLKDAHFTTSVVRAIGYAEQSLRPAVRRVTPISKVVVVFELGSPIGVAARNDGRPLARFAHGFVAGMDDAAGLAAHDGRQTGLRVELQPEVARRLLGVPMSELAGRIVDLPDLLPAAKRAPLEQLRIASNWEVRFDVVRRLFADRLDQTEALHAGVHWATQRIEATGGQVDIGALVRELGYSHKQTLRLFHEHVGLTPKTYARLVRFERLRGALLREGPGRMAALAARHGFADQAHLVHEVRRFSGTTPRMLGAEHDVPHVRQPQR